MKPLIGNTQWTERECIDEASVLGISEDKAKAYYIHYSCVGWIDGSQRPITSVRRHMVRCQLNGWWPKMPKKDSAVVFDSQARENARNLYEDWLREKTVPALEDMLKDPGNVPVWLIEKILKEKAQ